MKRLPNIGTFIVAAMLWLPNIGNATDSVLAYRPGAAVEQVAPWSSLPRSAYTNSAAWLIDSSLIDYSPNALDSDYVESPRLTFDGGGDYVLISSMTGTLEYFKCDFYTANIIDKNSAANWLCDFDLCDGIGFGITSSDFPNEIITVAAGSYRSTYRSDTGSISIGWHTLEVEWISDEYIIFLDGSGVSNDYKDTPVKANVTDTYTLGKFSSGAFFTGCIRDVVTETSVTENRLVFTEKSGSTAHDISSTAGVPNHNDGTLYPTVAGVYGPMWAGTQDVSHPFAEFGGSKVLSFDGDDSRVSIGRPDNINFTPQVEAWSFVQVIKLGDVSGTLYSFGAGALRQWQIFFESAQGKVDMWAGGTRSIATTDMRDGEYHTVIVTVPVGASGLKMYVDGSLELFSSGSGTIGTATDPVGAYIGGRGDGTQYNIAADIQDTLIYNKELTPAEVAQIALGEDVTDGLVSSWLPRRAYDNGTNVIIPDSTGTNNATGTNLEELYLPALADGTNDVAGLGITNPGGLVHNNGPQSISNSILGSVSFENLLTNSIYNASTNAAGLITEIYKKN